MAKMILRKSYECPLLKKMSIDLKNGRNSIIAVTGKVGVGKSTVALRIAQKFDPTFYPYTMRNIKDRLFFQSHDFSRNLENENNTSLNPGNAVILEELGYQASNKNFQSKANKALNIIFQTMRFRQLVLILTLPYISQMDKGLRQMIDFHVVVKNLDRKRKTNSCRIYERSPSDFKDKIYMPNMFFQNRKVINYKFIAPPKDLRNKYEKYSHIMKKKIIGEQTDIIQGKDETLDSLTKNLSEEEKIIEQIKKNPTRYKYQTKDKFNGKLIGAEFNVGDRRAYRLKMKLDQMVKDGIIVL